MALSADSRYITAKALIVSTDRGNVRALYRKQPQIQHDRRYTRHVVSEWDRMELVAAQLPPRSLGKAQQWWIVADINPQFHHPDELVAGALLRVPVV